ncbi:helix-turn-helix transcriptional regulator [Thiomicrorhabdus sp. Milos-T2]|uniref:helix-turn-helix transcriptional regulator n=1 Tax=Thiomicrorhabdus sp. Milos-T2 TaxID=90814 RepID=UPI000691EB75|nr:helix-turn-helix transcriptional regulator [Thiomicrorhabdus sp. Milos-T2]
MSFLQLKQPSNNEKLGDCIAKIYHHTQGNTLEQFKIACYEEINQIICLGECYWQIDLAPSYPLKINNNEKLFFSPQPAKNTMNSNENSLSDRFSECLSLQSSQQVIECIECHDSNITHHFYFSPNNMKTGFSSLDLEYLSLIIPNLIEALRLNILSIYQHQWITKPYANAICESSGIFNHVDDEFLQILHDINLKKTRSLPIEFITQTPFLQKKNALFKIEKVLDLYFIRGFVFKDQFSGLSIKEKEICFYLIQAISNNIIAQKMQLSIKTIENHLANIYLKTNIPTRARLIACLNKID